MPPLPQKQMNGALLDAEGLRVSFRGEEALRDVSLRVERGDFVTVIGPNGAGKTTLLKCLTGALKPDAGSVRRAQGLRIGYAPQQLAADRTMPMTALAFLTLHKAATKNDAARAAEEVNVASVLRKQLHELSGGEKQRVLLARAMLGEPHLLVLDEPAQNLDVSGRASFYELLARLYQQKQMAVLMVSHDLHLVMRATRRVICLYRHVCCSGEPQQVARDPQFAEMFGGDLAQLTAVYHHHHDHRHDNGA